MRNFPERVKNLQSVTFFRQCCVAHHHIEHSSSGSSSSRHCNMQGKNDKHDNREGMLSFRTRFFPPRLLGVFCRTCTDNFYFWVLVALFTLFEPILCSQYPTGAVLQLQVLVLFASSVLFVVQLLGVASKEWEKIHQMQLDMQDELMPVIEIKDMALLKLLIFFTAEGEYMFECACLMLGWLAIFINPGIAVLRCFRVYRLLW